MRGADLDRLSADTMALLQEFQQTQSSKLAAFERLQKKAESRFDDSQVAEFKFEDESDDEEEESGDGEEQDALASMEVFTEDWNLSQFWYTDATAHRLSAFVLDPLVKLGAYVAGREEKLQYWPRENYASLPSIKVAILSAPTVHQYLTRVILPQLPKDLSSKVQAVVFENDARFAVFGPRQFVHYDFNAPTRVPEATKGRFDAVLVDPPFLSEECQVKTAITVRVLLRKEEEGNTRPTVRVAVCTGQKVADVIERTYRAYGVRCTNFRPEHRNGLQNEFRCFASEAVEGVWEYE